MRMVRTLRAELGTEHGTVQRVARQLGYGDRVGAAPGCARPTSTTGYAPGVSTCGVGSGSNISSRRSENSSAPTRF